MPIQKSVWQETQLVQEMKRRNRAVRALVNGAAGIRYSLENKNGDREPSLVEFMPQEEKESKKAYTSRMLRTYVTPYLKNAVSAAAGQIFKNPLVIKPELPEALANNLQNVDLLGSDLNEWCMKATEESFTYGMAIAFCDFENPTGSDRLSDQMAGGAKPYLKLVSYFDLLGYSYDSQGRITMLRFQEEAEVEDDMLGSDRVEQVRIITPTSFKVYRNDENGNEQEVDSGEIVRWDEKGNRITDHVPAVVLYGRKLGTLNAACVFEDMAYINLQHTQVNSDLSWASHFYLIPMLFTMRGQDALPGENGPAISTLASHINVELEYGADVKWIETNGAAQESASRFLDDIEKRVEISKMDSSVSVSSGAVETATGRALDSYGTTAKLKLHAEAVEVFAKEIIKMFATYMPNVSLPEKLSVEANKDFSIAMDGQTVSELRNSVAAGQLSLETYLREIKRRGILADDVDIEMELERINQQAASQGML